ncbi:hypothetical protein Leryth_013098 [Lithospermum erythrorhizon]|nr:hypothetical protein Leryth_013098 [Lithospermum erythrorhizon]
MGKSPCCDEVRLKRGPWTEEEDNKLLAYIQQNGYGSWRTLPQKAGLKRCGKSCRLRWINYLRPDIKRGQFSAYEEQRIIQLHALLGNRWSVIAAHLPNRTDNEIKNYWNTHIKKRLTKMGIDPITHKKKQNLSSLNNKNMMMNLSVIDHIAQWESTRLEAEARLGKHPNIICGPHKFSPEKSPAEDNGFIMMRPSFDILKAWQSGYANINNVGAQPYTLSFLDTTVSMLAERESSKTATWNSGSAYDDNNIKNSKCDALLFSQNEIVVEEDQNVLVSEDGNGNVLHHPCNEGEWNIAEENYWSDLFLSNSETLHSSVCVLRMGKSTYYDGVDELRKGPWTLEEDKKLSAYIQENGHGSWRSLPQKAGLRRCGKSCRLRWINYLRPDIKRGQFTKYEEQKITQLHAFLGNRWSVIAAHLPNRTDNEIKNYWNTYIKKKLTKMGIDPITHKRKQSFSNSSSNEAIMNSSVIDHIAQWESTRLEAEARLGKLPNMVSGQYNAGEGSLMRPSFDILKAWQSGYANIRNNNVGAQPYTLSSLESAVSKLAMRESSYKTVAGTSGHSDSNVDKCDNNLWLSQIDDMVIDEDNRVLSLEDGNGGDNVVFSCNEEEWNLEEQNYWNVKISNPETLYSVVFNK